MLSIVPGDKIVLVAQSCATLCDPVDCSLPSFSVHEILQARILEWVTIPFSRWALNKWQLLVLQVTQWVKTPPEIQETQEMQVRSLSWEDPLKVEMATLSSILAWETPWTEKPGRLQSVKLQRIRPNWAHGAFTYAGPSMSPTLHLAHQFSA